MKLVIGNRNYSSWSLRAWLYMVESGLTFDVQRLALFSDGWDEEVRAVSPAARVPVLLDGPHTIWDSLAIIGHLREEHGARIGWPADPAARATARAVVHEMHSGFLAMRDELPQNLRARTPRDRADLSSTCNAQVDRVVAIWDDARSRFGGSNGWLFGDFGIADVLFAPVALRFVTYGITTAGHAGEFVAAVQALPSIRTWCEDAAEEAERIPFIDDLVPASASPLVLG